MSGRGPVHFLSGEGPPRKKKQVELAPVPSYSTENSSSTNPPTPSSLSPAPHFVFVDGRDASSRTRIQRHSMQHYIRQKRLREVQNLRSSAPTALQWQIRPHVPPESSQITREKVTLEDILFDTGSLRSPLQISSPEPIESTSSSSSSPNPHEPESIGLEPMKNEVDTETMEDESTSSTDLVKHRQPVQGLLKYFLNVSPQDHLGAGKDPFSTYPILVSYMDLNLIDYYAYSRCTRASHTTFFKKIMREAVADPASFHLLISYAAHHVSSCRSDGFLRPLEIQHKRMGVQSINDRLEQSTIGLADENIQAVLFMLALEDVFGSQQAITTHIDGFRRMIHARGGLYELKNPLLQLQIVWTELTATGRMSLDCIPYCDSGLVSNSDSAYLSAPVLDFTMNNCPTNNLHSKAQEFVFSMQDFQLLCFHRQTAGAENFAGTFYEGSQSKSVSLGFRVGTPLQRLLILPPEADDGDVTMPIRDHCHLASLILIHASLWKHRNSIAATDRFVQDLESQLVQDNLDHHRSSVESLLWALITDGNSTRLSDMEISRQAVQMMGIIRRISTISRNIVKDILMNGLLVRHWSEVGVLDSRWDANRIMREALTEANSLQIE